MSEKKEKIEIHHLGFFVYIVYMLWIVLVEWINFGYKMIFLHNLHVGVAETIALLIFGAFFYINRNNLSIDLKRPDKEVIIGAALLFVTGAFISFFPDTGFDTLNYHIIAQNPNFENYFTEDFAYGNFQVWGFRMCDRMFFYFRKLLGYRFGTILNTLALIVSFTLVYELLGELTQEDDPDRIKKLVCNRLVWSLAIILSLDAIMMFGSYYVDAITMPLGVYAISTVIRTYRERTDSKKIAVFALICGLWIGGKLTNVVYVVPCVIVYVFFHFRDFKLWDWISSIALGVLSFAEYLVFNYVCTGNPLFPYYNTIFKSIYFPHMDFKDLRWGGQNTFEKIFWVAYAAVKPEYRQSEIWDKRNALLMAGLVSGLMLIIYSIFMLLRKKQFEKEILILLSIAVSSAVLWGFTTGVGRYYMFGRVMWGIIAYYGVRRILMIRPMMLPGVISAALSCIILGSVCLNLVDSVKQGGWSYSIRSLPLFIMQFPRIFRDRGTDVKGGTGLYLHSDPMSMGVAELIEPDAYSYQLSYDFETECDKDGILKEKLDQYGYGVDFHNRSFWDIEAYTERINSRGFVIEDVISYDTEIDVYEGFCLKPGAEANTVWTSNLETAQIDVSQSGNSFVLSFIGGMSYDWPSRDITLVIYSEQGVLGEVDIDESSIQKYEEEFELPEGTDIIMIDAFYADSYERIEKNDIYFAFCLNLKAQ